MTWPQKLHTQGEDGKALFTKSHMKKSCCRGKKLTHKQNCWGQPGSLALTLQYEMYIPRWIFFDKNWVKRTQSDKFNFVFGLPCLVGRTRHLWGLKQCWYCFQGLIQFKYLSEKELLPKYIYGMTCGTTVIGMTCLSHTNCCIYFACSGQLLKHDYALGMSLSCLSLVASQSARPVNDSYVLVLCCHRTNILILKGSRGLNRAVGPPQHFHHRGLRW